MDLTAYRASDKEKARIKDLFGLIPMQGAAALDVGARDGFLSVLLAERFATVTALDLEPPSITHPAITCVKGDVSALTLADNTFDVVLCAEVLEHLPAALLPKACAELARVSKRYVVLGVPYRQDIRVGRTTCYACGQKNPPWGHINRFDETILQRLFAPWMAWDETSFVGETSSATNALSTLLLDWAGNPYGTYEQEEPCITCGKRLQHPPARTLVHKVLTRSAHLLNVAQARFVSPHANWIHVRFMKRVRDASPA